MYDMENINQVMQDIEANSRERTKLYNKLAAAINGLVDSMPKIYNENDSDYILGRVYYDEDEDKLYYETESTY